MFDIRWLKGVNVVAVLVGGVFIASCLIPAQADAEWQLYKNVSVFSRDGHGLRLETVNGKNIMIYFILRHEDKLVFDKKFPVYRVDDNNVHRIEKGEKFRGLRERKGRWIRWEISQGSHPSKALSELMNGQQLVFQYYRNDGKIMEAMFQIGGAQQAIKKLYTEF